MPTDVTSDQDFMAAHPDEQAAYLKSIDPDFAQAPPTEQRMYLSHINKVAPDVPRPSVGGMIQEDEKSASLAGVPGGSPNVRPASDTARNIALGGIGVAAAGALGPEIPGIVRAHPLLTQMAASAAISEGRKIPYVGKMIPPYAEFAPYLFGGGKGKIPPAAEAEAATVKPPPEVPGPSGFTPSQEALRAKWQARGGGVAPEPIDRTTLRGQPITGAGIRPGPEAAPSVAPPTQRQPLSLPAGQYEAPASPLPPQKALGEGVLEGEYMEEPPPPPPTIRGALPRGQYAAPASSLPPPRQLSPGAPPIEAPARIQTPIEQGPRPFSYPPEEPTSPYRIKAQNSRAELIDDKGVQERMRGYLDNQDRQVHAFEPIGKSKGVINEEFNEQMRKPSPPVKYTKMPSAKASSRIQNSVEATPADADLEQLLRDSVDQAKKKKGR